MTRPGQQFNCCTLAVAAFLLNPPLLFSGEIVVWVDRGAALRNTDLSLSLSSVQIPAAVNLSPFYDDSKFKTGYLDQANNNDVVICSYVAKVVMCHRIVRSCPPRLLLPIRRPPRKPQRDRLLLVPYRC